MFLLLRWVKGAMADSPALLPRPPRPRWRQVAATALAGALPAALRLQPARPVNLAAPAAALQAAGPPRAAGRSLVPKPATDLLVRRSPVGDRARSRELRRD